MKRRLLYFVLCLAGAGFYVASIRSGSGHNQQPQSSSTRRILYYLDPMNPSHTSSEPGVAPCGMKMEPVYADVQATRYARSFVLSGELETDAIDAKLKDGVLTIRIPKRSEFRPRKVEVRAG